MTALADEGLYPVKALDVPLVLGLLVVSIGAAGVPTIVGPCAGITCTRASAGAYDFVFPTHSGATIIAIPHSLVTSTVVGFRGNSGGSRVLTLVEAAGVIAVGDPGNGDLLMFLILAAYSPPVL